MITWHPWWSPLIHYKAASRDQELASSQDRLDSVTPRLCSDIHVEVQRKRWWIFQSSNSLDWTKSAFRIGHARSILNLFISNSQSVYQCLDICIGAWHRTSSATVGHCSVEFRLFVNDNACFSCVLSRGKLWGTGNLILNPIVLQTAWWFNCLPAWTLPLYQARLFSNRIVSSSKGLHLYSILQASADGQLSEIRAVVVMVMVDVAQKHLVVVQITDRKKHATG